MKENIDLNNNIGFEPLIDNDSKILILGSFPSVKSRENLFYYGHPQNRFWKMLAYIFNENQPKSIEEKKELCRKHKIALWDVVIESNIKGSSDLALEKSNYKIANIPTLLKNHPSINGILCNGKFSFKLYNSYFADLKIDAICMPSTSPANARFDITIWENEIKKRI